MIDEKTILSKAQVAAIRSDAALLLTRDDLGQGLIADMPLHVIALVDTVKTLRAALAAANARAERLARVVRADDEYIHANDADPDSGVGHKILLRWDAIVQERCEAHDARQPGDLGETEPK